MSSNQSRSGTDRGQLDGGYWNVGMFLTVVGLGITIVVANEAHELTGSEVIMAMALVGGCATTAVAVYLGWRSYDVPEVRQNA